MDDKIFALFSVQTDLKTVIHSWGMIAMTNGVIVVVLVCIYGKK